MEEETKRALAYIAKVEEIRPIPGYDRVEHVRVLGWWVVCRKDEFKVGDNGVYFEIDSLVPATDKRFEFLESRKFKVKTIKMCKVYSQGLLLPTSLFPEVENKPIGFDCTDILGIKYYVPEDNVRKSNAPADPNAKYKSMAARHSKLARQKWFRWLMRREWGKKLLFKFFGKKKDKQRGWPAYLKKTDETRCLEASTKILTDAGKIKIIDIVNKKLDVAAMSYNIDSGKLEFKKIIGYQKFQPEPMLKIKYLKRYDTKLTLTSANSQSIICSMDHMLYTPNGYKKASDITIDDKLMIFEESITDEAIPFLYGLLIGDSFLNIDCSSSARLSFTHGEKQLEYLKEKLRLMNVDSNKTRASNSGYCSHKVYAGHSKSYTILYRKLMEDNAIVDGKLVKTREFCNRLTPESLAFWYLDDGTIRHKDDGLSPTIEFSTHSESEEEVRNLMRRLQEFGIESVRYTSYRNSKFNGYTIRLNADDTYYFLDLIKNYIPYCMRYKTIVKFENVDYCLKNVAYLNKTYLAPVPIVEITESKSRPLYDITVEDNHNFIANDILNHNCEMIPDIVNDKSLYSVSEKMDGTSCSYSINKNKRDYDFYVCSRNVVQNKQGKTTSHDYNIYWELANKYDIEKKLRHFIKANNYETVVLQGEGVGRVQGNPYKLKEDDLYCFNLVIDGVKVSNKKLCQFCDEYGLKHVPIIYEHHKLPNTLEELKLEADGFSAINPNVRREGFVYRTEEDNPRSFKNVSNAYLLKHKELDEGN